MPLPGVKSAFVERPRVPYTDTYASCDERHDVDEALMAPRQSPSSAGALAVAAGHGAGAGGGRRRRWRLHDRHI